MIVDSSAPTGGVHPPGGDANLRPALMTAKAAETARLGFELWDDLTALNLTEGRVTAGHGIAVAYYNNPATTGEAFTPAGNNDYSHEIGPDEYAINARRIWIEHESDTPSPD